jgi:hypothetical protein
MTGYTVHTGSTEKFTEGWDNIFSDHPQPAKKSKSKKPAKKKAASGKATAKKKPARKKTAAARKKKSS